MENFQYQSAFGVDEDAFDVLGVGGGVKMPEQRLLLAVLERAIRDYLGGSEADAADAREWLYDEDEAFHAFSFRWICQFLELDHVNVRRKLEEALEASRTGQLPFFLDKRFVDTSKVQRQVA